jgi:hypothetical protein
VCGSADDVRQCVLHTECASASAKLHHTALLCAAAAIITHLRPGPAQRRQAVVINLRCHPANIAPAGAHAAAAAVPTAAQPHGKQQQQEPQQRRGSFTPAARQPGGCSSTTVSRFLWPALARGRLSLAAAGTVCSSSCWPCQPRVCRRLQVRADGTRVCWCLRKLAGGGVTEASLRAPVAHTCSLCPPPSRALVVNRVWRLPPQLQGCTHALLWGWGPAAGAAASSAAAGGGGSGSEAAAEARPLLVEGAVVCCCLPSAARLGVACCGVMSWERSRHHSNTLPV